MNFYRIAHWDVDNEALHGDFFERRTFNMQFMENLFHQARLLDKDVTLMTNDYDIIAKGLFTSAYHRQIGRMKANGVPIGGIGIQNHMMSYPDVDLVKVC